MNLVYAFTRMWSAVYISAAMSLVACSGEAVHPEPTAIKACESNLDQSFTLAMRGRAIFLESQHLRLWTEVQKVDPKFTGDVDAVSVKNIGLKFGGDGQIAILANPVSGSMSYAAQKSWQKGEVVLPRSPNLIRKVEDLTTSEEFHLNSAYGWSVTAKSMSNGDVLCQYESSRELNPWRNTSLFGSFLLPLRRSVSMTAESVLVNGEVISAKLTGGADSVDSTLLKWMDKNHPLKVWNTYPSILGNPKTMELARQYVKEERERLSQRKAEPVNVFWFEEVSK